MATVRIHLDKRTVRKDGTSPLKLYVCHKGKAAFASLNIFVPAQNWNETTEKITGLPNRANLNAFLFQKKLNAENIVLKLASEGFLDAMDVAQLKNAISGKDSVKPGSNGFADAFRQFIKSKNKQRTREVYNSTLRKLYAFCPELDNLDYKDVTKGWLVDFDTFLAKTSPSKNARNIHLRNIRAVFNYAIDEEYTVCYPFRRFKIRPEETRKRSLTAEQLRMLRDFPCEEHQAKYRDIFLLMFCLIGINPIDLLHAEKADVVEGRLEYRRAKTGKLYSVKIEPEAWEIINRHAGKGKYLLDVLERYANYRDFTARMNRELKHIGPMERRGRGGKKVVQPLFPDLSAYWARHSWATVAYSLDVPKETISEALGHEIGSRVTSIYIRFDRRKVDVANRRVLDYVLHGGE